MKLETKILHEVRAVKTKKELDNIIKAQRISEKVLAEVLKFLKDGVSEIEVADFIKESFVKYGAPTLSFLPIVAFGKNSANIHHKPSNAKLIRPTRLGVGGTIIMFDFGTTINHYCSDMTRTYFWGEPSAKQKKLYLAVLEAQERAIKKLSRGEKRAGVVDKIARDFLSKIFKNNFKHGLGHGVGNVIHEWPNFKPKSTDILPVGCVMTLEPGIYLKNFGGVRIEDMVLINDTGCTNLTQVPKDLKSVIL